MRHYARKRSRPLLTGATILAAMAASAFAMIGPAAWTSSPANFVSGLQATPDTIWIALALGLVFALWLLMGERRRRDRKFLGRRPNGRANLLATVRPLSVILGAAALIVGAFSAIYAAFAWLYPDALAGADLPFGFPLAIASLLLGAALYAAGRFERR